MKTTHSGLGCKSVLEKTLPWILSLLSPTVAWASGLNASDGVAGDWLGTSVGISGNIGIAGAYAADVGTRTDRGAAYIFRDLNTVTGNVTESAKLVASDGWDYDNFGFAVCLSGNTSLIGAWRDMVGSSTQQGSAYIFRNLDTVTGTRTEDLKLIASDGVAGDRLGRSASLCGNIALVGAYFDDIGANVDQGSAYIFRNVDTGSGTRNEDLKLVASDGAAGDILGHAVSISGSSALVGAYLHDIGSNINQGSAYLYRNIHTGTGTRTEDLKLVASDGAGSDLFGFAVGISGSTAIVGAYFDDVGTHAERGSAYIYLNLDTGTGTRTEDLQVLASDGTSSDLFGNSVSIDGDHFVIGAHGKDFSKGKAYSGSVASMTTMDLGNSTREIDLMSFNSRRDWIIGDFTSKNTVVLTAEDSASVLSAGKQVYVGKNVNSDNNTLVIDGVLTAHQVFVGNGDNTGNELVVNGTVNAPVRVYNEAILSGSGTIYGTVILDFYSQISPGQSIGTLTTDNQTWRKDAGYLLEMKTDGTGSAGFEWDKLMINGLLSIAATSADPFEISLVTMSDSSTPGLLAVWDPNVPHNWAGFVTTTGGLTGFDADKFVINTAGFQNPLNGTFSVTLKGTNLDLVYTPIPESATAAMVLLGSLTGVVAFRRRCCKNRSTNGQ